MQFNPRSAQLNHQRRYRHTVDEVRVIVRQRIEIGRRARGYILSSAYSVAPVVPPENIAVLRKAAEQYGRFTPR